MAHERSLLGWVLKNFLNSIRPKKNLWGTLKGRDEFGVEYYEDSTALRGKRPSRWFAPPEGNSDPELPVEWEAWLRHKRKLPPTQEEINLNRLRKMKTIENAMKLENAVKTPQKEKKEVKPFNKPAFPLHEGFTSDPSFSETKSDKQ